jgi:hypothetical protein
MIVRSILPDSDGRDRAVTFEQRGELMNVMIVEHTLLFDESLTLNIDEQQATSLIDHLTEFVNRNQKP